MAPSISRPPLRIGKTRTDKANSHRNSYAVPSPCLALCLQRAHFLPAGPVIFISLMGRLRFGGVKARGNRWIGAPGHAGSPELKTVEEVWDWPCKLSPSGFKDETTPLGTFLLPTPGPVGCAWLHLLRVRGLTPHPQGHLLEGRGWVPFLAFPERQGDPSHAVFLESTDEVVAADARREGWDRNLAREGSRCNSM